MPVTLGFELVENTSLHLQQVASLQGLTVEMMLQELAHNAGYDVVVTTRQKSLQLTINMRCLEANISQLYLARRDILLLCNPQVLY